MSATHSTVTAARLSKGSAVPAQLAELLRERFGDRYATSSAVCQHHGRDESPFDSLPPDAVVFASSTDDVSATLALANRFSVPVIAYGAGSSLEGQLLAVRGGICLDLSRMSEVREINTDDGLAVVEAGVTRNQLNQALRHHGMFFSVDPGADASVGGMVATRASGTNTVRYGTIRDNVLAMTVVVSDGRIIRTGSRARKSASGYDLTRLFIGSEGTLGVVTEVTVRLHPVPEASSVAICQFPDIGAAVRTATEIMQLGIPIARCELLDEVTAMALNRHSKLNLAERPMLLMEFHGTATSVAEQVESVQVVALGNGGEQFEWATLPEERNRLWKARHNAYFASLQLRPGSRAVTTDACVPISRLAQCIGETRADLKEAGLIATILGHVGDGNFHVAMMIEPGNPAELELAESVNSRLVERAIGAGGTCTGEHGVGLHKRRFMEREHGMEGLELMRSIKRALDPNEILNPGKIFP